MNNYPHPTGSPQQLVFSEHLADLSKHDYKLEPNIRFSPDHKYVIFTWVCASW
jgi:hypothetical protein